MYLMILGVILGNGLNPTSLSNTELLSIKPLIPIISLQTVVVSGSMIMMDMKMIFLESGKMTVHYWTNEFQNQ